MTPWTLLFVFAAISLAALGSVLFLVLGGPEPVWGRFDPEDFEPRARSRAERLREKLHSPVNLDKGIDADTPLKDAIEFLADKYAFPMLIDTKAFEAIGVQKVEEQPVSLPKLVGVSLRTVLRLLMGQIKGDVHTGTYIVQDDTVLLTTTAHVFQGENVSLENGILPPTVDVNVHQKPLRAVLREIGDSTGVNVLIDPRVGDKARRPISATFAHVPVDSAVRLLTDMTGLRMVVMDNVLYVTSPENAKEMQAEQNARNLRRREADRPAPSGLFPEERPIVTAPK
jgi:hypothetical protein